MAVLLTGAAGFIGSHVGLALLSEGRRVIGLDNLNDYYDPALKQARLARLQASAGFSFHKVDVADREAILALAIKYPEIEVIVHLAAQAGVRHSLKDPYSYVRANVNGHLVLMELARKLPHLEHFVYASSSSVYGGNKKVPYAVEDRVDQPLSLYAATKRAGELMSQTYAHLYGLPMTGLRFFTVYGPWGRPDMAAYIFTKAIFEGRPIPVFNFGRMRRDFTYIDDIVAGVLAVCGQPPIPTGEENGAPHRLYNLGNSCSEPLEHFIEVLEQACGREAIKDYQPLQPGDVAETFADITRSRAELGFTPKMTIEEGLPRFVAWFRDYHGL